VDYPILSVLWTILFCLYCGLSYFVCIVDYPILFVLWTILFCLYCGLSYFVCIVDYPILTNPFRNLPWCSVICYYLYIVLLHYKYDRGIFLPLCFCTYTNVIQFG
jgi:hypothetical protein